MPNQAINGTSGRVPRGTPRVNPEQAQRNALALVGSPLATDPIEALTQCSPTPIPTEPGEQCDAFLARLLRPDRFYNLVASIGHQPDFPGGIFQKEELCTEYKCSIPLASPGGFLRFNPISGPGSGHKNSHCDRDVTDFDYLLVESDSLPIDLQGALILKLVEMGLPIVSAVHTGGKSFHALIRVSAKDADAFRSIKTRIYSRLVRLGYDPSTGNPSRMTRLPGCMRTFANGSTALQKLLYLA
jgi:hypothetical protein